MPEVVVAVGLVREFVAGGQRVRAVDGVDLTVAAGELLMVLGRSGAGKTTLLSIIGALDRPDSGTVTVGCERVDMFNERERDRFLQRSVGLGVPDLRTRPAAHRAENMELALRLAGIHDTEIAERAAMRSTTVGLGERGAHRAAELSGGEQQRVGRRARARQASHAGDRGRAHRPSSTARRPRPSCSCCARWPPTGTAC